MKPNPVNIAFGKKLAEERKRSEITQVELGDRVGVVRTTIANLEAGRQSISLPLLYRIALALKCELNSLLPPIETSLSDAGDITESPSKRGGWAERVIRKPSKNSKTEKED